MKKIGIIGSGVVARTLAAGFANHGYEVMMGSRDQAKLTEMPSEIQKGHMKEAAEFGDLIVLAVKGSAMDAAIQEAGPENLRNKIVIDTNNPIDETKYPFAEGVIAYFTQANSSLMEEMQMKYPEVRFVKAFNSVGSGLMVNPDFGGIRPSMFICGNDKDAKNEVRQVLDQFGWEAEDMGTARSAGPIESLCVLWCIPGFRSNQWVHAFKLLKKQPR